MAAVALTTRIFREPKGVRQVSVVSEIQELEREAEAPFLTLADDSNAIMPIPMTVTEPAPVPAKFVTLTLLSKIL